MVEIWPVRAASVMSGGSGPDGADGSRARFCLAARFFSLRLETVLAASTITTRKNAASAMYVPLWICVSPDSRAFAWSR